MNKPLLIIITGRPASGKTTLAHMLSKQIKLPLLSRDELKEGYMNTIGAQLKQPDNSVNWYIYETFFQSIDLLITKGVSIIVEAAFQHKLWKPKLLDFLDKADIRIIICEIDPELAKTRFVNRLLNDSGREKFHNENPIISADAKVTSLIETYENINIDVSILHVDTTDQYNPDIEVIVDFIRPKSNQ